jgi:hypothetical protein
MRYRDIINKLTHYADILAIPCFALLAYYLYNIENKTIVEYFLFLFAITGFLLDIIFTYYFLNP